MPRNSEFQRYRNIDAGVMPIDITASAAELNVMDTVTASAVELNKLTGCTATTAELNQLAGKFTIGLSGAIYDKTGDYTCVLTDANSILNLGTTAATATITIPANTVVAFPVGTVIGIAKSTNAAAVAVTTDTLLGATAIAATTFALLFKVGATTWVRV